MTYSFARTIYSAVVLGLVFCARPAQAGIGGLTPPNINVNPQRINPFNPDSDVRRGLREFDSRARQAGRDLDKETRAFIRKIENFGSEEAYIAYRDHVISRNIGRGNPIKPGSLHDKMIRPAFAKSFDIHKVKFHFNAYVPADMAAITFGNNVYVRGPHLPNEPHQALLLGHELTHSRQYEELGGERAFARRYWGQIWASIRKGQGGGVSCFHDSLGLEQEANAMEKRIGKLTHAGVTIWNQTPFPVHYALKRHHRGKWKSFTLESGRSLTHSTNFVELTDDDYVFFSIHFDHDFAPGYQEKAYHLNYDMVFNGQDFPTGQGEVYHFERRGKGVDLFTGKGFLEKGKITPVDPLPGKDTTLTATVGKKDIVMNLRFQAGRQARFLLQGEGRTDVDVFVYDSAGKQVARDTGLTDRCDCRWNPSTTQTYRIVIRNLGKVANRCQITHNGSVP